MRIAYAFAVLSLTAGCGGDGIAPNSDLTMSGGGDLAGADLSGQASPDLSGQASPDLSGGSSDDAMSMAMDLGGQGAMCKTACDCMPGLACLNGQCMAGKMPVYCCGSKTCPQGEACQDANGNFMRCGGGSDGGVITMPDGGKPLPDGGLQIPDGFSRDGFDFCPQIDCANNNVQKCILAGCPMCVKSNAGMVCSR